MGEGEVGEYIPITKACTDCRNQTFPSSNERRCGGMLPGDWMYDKPTDYSIVTDFDIKCEDRWKLELITSIFFLGWLLGAFVLGWFCDNYGRKMVLVVSTNVVIITGLLLLSVYRIFYFCCCCCYCLVVVVVVFYRLQIGILLKISLSIILICLNKIQSRSIFYFQSNSIQFTGFLTIFMPSIYLIIACRFIIGFFLPGTMIQSFIIISELVGAKNRPFAGLMIFVFGISAITIVGREIVVN